MKKYLLLGLFSLLITSCAPIDYKDNLNRNYDDYKESYITNIHDEMFTKEEDKYLVYIFRRECGSCIDVKGALLDYLDAAKTHTQEYKLYLYEWVRKTDVTESDLRYFKGSIYEATDVNRYINEMIGKNRTEDCYIYGTPSLYVIENNVLASYLYLTNDIGSYLVSHK